MDNEIVELSKAVDEEMKIRKLSQPVVVKPWVTNDKRKGIVYNIVMEPNTPDVDGHEADAEAIELAAHAFIAKGSRTCWLDHKQPRQVQIVESYITPAEMVFQSQDGTVQKVKQGSWILGAKIPDSETDIWDRIDKGQLKGWSMKALVDLKPKLSFVNKPKLKFGG